MKRTITAMAITCLASFSCLAGDVLTLTNNKMFEGKVVRIRKCEVIFKAGGERYVIPGEEIKSILFEDIQDKVYLDYLGRDITNAENCLRGQTDAAAFHGKKVGHFFLGFLFGPFAIIGTAVSNPTPIRGRDTFALSPNKELFSDPEYLTCYKKKAKGGLIGMEALGWGLWILIVVASSANQ